MGSLTIDKVKKSFGRVDVLKGIDLAVNDGEFVVFVGPSGCGKSTLLRLIAGLEDVSGGQILIDGKDVTGNAPAERGLAMVFQSYALYPHMSVRNNIAFPLKMAKLDKAAIDRKVELLQLVVERDPWLGLAERLYPQAQPAPGLVGHVECAFDRGAGLALEARTVGFDVD